ncbi:MAG: nicotinate-nicotinamide nucleotide adenylyltransferase [Phycisphaerales bacterium]
MAKNAALRKQSRNTRQPPVTTLPKAFIRAAQQAGTVLLYGGSFDPPHAYHLAAQRFAAAAVDSGRAVCLYVPAARSPLKDTGPAAGDADRVAMLRAMLKARRGAAVWTDEVDRAAWLRERGTASPSYTIDTVRRLRALLGKGVRVRLVIGTDQAVAFHRWRSARTLLRMAEPVVLPRAGITNGNELVNAMRTSAARTFWTTRETAAWAARMADAPLVAESSTQLRQLLRGTRAERARALKRLPAPAASVIRTRGLYPPAPSDCPA